MTASVNQYAVTSNCLYIWQCCLMIFLKLCDFAKMAFACECHDMEYREICYSFCKSMSHQSSCFRNMSHDKLNVTDWVNKYGDNRYCLYICFCMILASLVSIKVCDFAKTAWVCLITSWHGVQRNMLAVFIKACLINLLYQSQNMVHDCRNVNC